MSRTGIWIVGSRGGVATTLVCGALAVRHGLTTTTGLLTATELFDGVDLVPLENLVFGGHDIRHGTIRDAACEIAEANGTIPLSLIQAIETDLVEVEANQRIGVLHQSGSAIESLPQVSEESKEADPSAALDRLVTDLEEFKERNALQRLVVVNLASTEPTPAEHPALLQREELEKALAEGDRAPLISSSLYSIAAARVGAALLNFTPSPGALCPSIAQLLEEQNCPFMGSDGKTGETLVKSALAPMFRYRHLKVLSWQGYNMLGDRDGAILANAENRDAKIRSKDHLLHEYLGYPLHSKVTIDYVPSLDDFKTAWDFIHFEGFLGVKMSLQFTWQGCDSILAAPLVLDLVRCLDLALRRSERGPQSHLSLFFKDPYGDTTQDLHRQFHLLADYLQNCRGESAEGR